MSPTPDPTYSKFTHCLINHLDYNMISPIPDGQPACKTLYNLNNVTTPIILLTLCHPPQILITSLVTV